MKLDRRLTAETLALATAYWVAGRLTLFLAIPPGYATAIWPPAGIALGVLYARGSSRWPGVLIGSFLVNLGTALDTSTVAAATASITLPAAIAGGACLQALAGTFLLRRLGVGAAPERLRDSVLFLVAGGVVAGLVSPTVGVGSLTVAGAIAAEGVAFAWWTWWVGDVIGIFLAGPLALCWLEPIPWRGRRLATSVCLLVSSLAIYSLFYLGGAADERLLRSRFDRASLWQRLAIEKFVAQHIENVHGIRGHLEGSRPVDREEFRRFTRRIVRHAESRGIHAIEWIQRVPSAERPAYEAAVRAEGVEGFAITERARDGRLIPAADRPDHFPVDLVEPWPANRSVLGFDLFSDPERRRALEDACASGRATATRPIRLVQEQGDQAGFLLLVPTFAEGPIETADDRRRQLVGYVCAVFRASDLVEAAIAETGQRRLRVRITDVASDRVLHSSFEADSLGDSPFHVDDTLDVGARQWRIEFFEPRETLPLHELWSAWATRGGALLIAALISLLTLSPTGQTSIVQRRVDERTRDLDRANRRLREREQDLQNRNLALEEANRRLREVDRLKSEFLGSVSHELRTPLTSIKGSIGLLAGGRPTIDEATAAELLDICGRNVERLATLIEDLLDLQRIESGRIEYDLRPVDLGQLVRDACEEVTGYAPAEKEVAIEVVAAPSISIESDGDRLAQVLRNLLSNAIQHAPDRSRVAVGLSPEDGWARLTVDDQGPGIPPDLREAVFDRFFQADGSTERWVAGTGLGLAICRAIVDDLGGSIAIEEADGGGCRAVVRLPLATN